MLYLRRARCGQISVGTLMRAMDVRFAILTQNKREKCQSESDSSMHLAKIRARTWYSFCVAFYKRKLVENLSLLHTHITGALAMTLS
jgi:hypothetical protein